MSRASSAGNAAQQEQTEATTVIDGEAQVIPQGNQDANSEQQVQSSSTEDATDATLASVIRDAIKPKEAEDPESSDRKEEGATENADGDTTLDADGKKPTDEADKKPVAEDADVPFHKHPRWKELKQERDTYRAGHEQFEHIQGFMASNHLEASEVARGFEIMALLRNDPEKALEALQPYVQQLELVTGRRLPQDLQERVDNDILDEETARETARLRLEAQENRAAAETLLTERTQTQQVNQTQAIQTAVGAVVAEIQSGDPDFARKQPFVMDRVRALIIEKQPRTIEESTAIVRQAHSEISAQLKPMVQQRKPVTAVTSSESASGSSAAPKSFAEAVRQAAKATG